MLNRGKFSLIKDCSNSKASASVIVEKVSILSVRILICCVFLSLKDLPKYDDTLFLKSLALPIYIILFLEKNLYIPGVFGTCFKSYAIN